MWRVGVLLIYDSFLIEELNLVRKTNKMATKCAKLMLMHDMS